MEHVYYDTFVDWEQQLFPFIAPKFNWQADNLYAHFQIFRDKVTFAFDGQFKEASNESKCGAFLN